MKVIIDIPYHIYEMVTNTGTFGYYHFDTRKAIRNGTPIPDNATVGEVFCMLAHKEPICETASYFTIDKELWNSSYQKGGKE